MTKISDQAVLENIKNDNVDGLASTINGDGSNVRHFARAAESFVLTEEIIKCVIDYDAMKCCQWFVDNGYPFHDVVLDGRQYALHYAVDEKKKDFVLLFQEQGVDIDAFRRVPNEEGFPPDVIFPVLRRAIEGRDADMAAFLFDCGARWENVEISDEYSIWDNNIYIAAFSGSLWKLEGEGEGAEEEYIRTLKGTFQIIIQKTNYRFDYEDEHGKGFLDRLERSNGHRGIDQADILTFLKKEACVEVPINIQKILDLKASMETAVQIKDVDAFEPLLIEWMSDDIQRQLKFIRPVIMRQHEKNLGSTLEKIVEADAGECFKVCHKHGVDLMMFTIKNASMISYAIQLESLDIIGAWSDLRFDVDVLPSPDDEECETLLGHSVFCCALQSFHKLLLVGSDVNYHLDGEHSILFDMKLGLDFLMDSALLEKSNEECEKICEAHFNNLYEILRLLDQAQYDFKRWCAEDVFEEGTTKVSDRLFSFGEGIIFNDFPQVQQKQKEMRAFLQEKMAPSVRPVLRTVPSSPS